MNYTSLIADKTTSGSIKRWVGHSIVDSEQVLEEAQALVAQGLRVREMRVAAPLAMVVGDYYRALPARFLEPISLKDSTNNITLSLRTPDQFLRDLQYDTGATVPSGTPYNYTVYNELLLFDATYDAAATLGLVYYGKPALLSNSNQTNFLTDRYPQILRVACMAQAFNFRDESDREQVELAKLSALFQRANAEADQFFNMAVVENRIA